MRLVFALLASIALHMALFWNATPNNAQHSYQSPIGQTMAIKLGKPPAPQTIALPKIEEIITTNANEAKNVYTKSKAIEKEPLTHTQVIAQQEELLITREIQLRSQPTPPIYPEQARRKKQEGLVLVRAHVDSQGATKEVKVAQSSGFSLLDEAALQAVMQWAFVPATQNKKAISAWIEVPIDFKLR